MIRNCKHCECQLYFDAINWQWLHAWSKRSLCWDELKSRAEPDE